MQPHPPKAPEAAGLAVPRKILVGLIGAGIQRSLSPALHESEARAMGLQLHYQLIDLDVAGLTVAALPGLLGAARDMGFAGLNITYPCKQAVLPLLDEVTAEAAAMGAVNTVVFEGRRAIGHNTDGSGWVVGFERSLPGADLGDVVLIGAGGAGSAIAESVMGLGARHLRVIDADPARAEALVVALNRRHAGGRAEPVGDGAAALRGATGLIQATPVGMDKLPGMPVDPAWLHPRLWVSEVIYFPLETALLRAARALGCAVSDGGGMAVGQALGAFRRFTGHEPDPARMEVVFRRLVAARGDAPPT